MSLWSKTQPLGCVSPRRMAKRLVGRSTGLAAVALIGFCQPAAAQTETLTNGGVVPGAMSCAPSNNGTGHMVCLEYLASGSLLGLSWQAPPGATGEPTDTVDVDP